MKRILRWLNPLFLFGIFIAWVVDSVIEGERWFDWRKD